MRFEGKRVVVTGGASGIGRAAVEAFLAEGAQVAMGDVNETVGREMAADPAFEGRLVFRRTDVLEERDIVALLDRATDEFDGIDILLNNAGAGGSRARIDEISADEWDYSQRLLLRSVALGIRHVVPHMKRAGGGVIVNIASITAHEAGGGPIAYSVAKAGVKHLSKIAAAELAQHGIRVVSISPGLILTNIFAETFRDDEATARAVDQTIRTVAPAAQPVRRAGKPEDIAQAVLYLASDAAGFVTGTDLLVDGGITVGPRHSWDPDTQGIFDLIPTGR